MNASVRVVASIILCAAAGYSDDACPSAAIEKSGATAGLSWTSGTQRIGDEKVCTRQQISSLNPDAPLAVRWPAAGILSTEMTGQLVSSFCCSEGVELKKEIMKYGTPEKAVDTLVHAGAADTNQDYPDLIEDDAKTKRSSFAGKLWDGSKYVDIDIELRASASNPHFNQSVFQFVIIDQSPEPVSVDWSLLTRMSKTMEPYFTGTPEGSKYRQNTYVFFGKEHPSPVRGTVEVKTASGKLLGRFFADGFTNGK